MLMVLLPLTAVLVIFVKNAWSYTAKEQPLTARNILMALVTGMTIGHVCKDRGKISGNGLKEQRLLLYLPSSSFTISTATTQIITGRMTFAPFFTAKPAPM